MSEINQKDIIYMIHKQSNLLGQVTGTLLIFLDDVSIPEISKQPLKGLLSHLYKELDELYYTGKSNE